MKISDVNLGAHRPDVVRKRAVEQADSVQARAAEGPSEQKDVSALDRVEISNEARSVSSDQEQLKREVEFARRAMYSMPPLSEERAQEILKRLDEGEYNAPDVRIKLSQLLSSELVADAPEAGGRAESA